MCGICTVMINIWESAVEFTTSKLEAWELFFFICFALHSYKVLCSVVSTRNRIPDNYICFYGLYLPRHGCVCASNIQVSTRSVFSRLHIQGYVWNSIFTHEDHSANIAVDNMSFVFSDLLYTLGVNLLNYYY